jgi:hypothetical protein
MSNALGLRHLHISRRRAVVSTVLTFAMAKGQQALS